MTDFDADRLSEYCEAVGMPGLKKLWHDFAADTESFFASALSDGSEELRLKFHNLRAGSLVFGLTGFSKICAELENALVRGVSVPELADEIKQATQMFSSQRTKVDAYLEKEDGTNQR